MAPKPTYTDQQLELYLNRIGYSHYAQSEGNLLQHLRQGIENDAFSALCVLQRRHLTAIPWGNSGLHYSQHHTISLNPQSLFEKMVKRRLDGYCMENTGLFLIVLRSLGYLVYATGGRVSQAAAGGLNNGLYLPLGHMILIVIIGGEKYMIDVGFGNNCATAPLLLQDGATATAIAPSEMRIVRESIAEFTDQSQKIWIYQTRYNPESDWLPTICFSDVEFLPQDFGVMNFSVSQSRTSWFTHVFVCMRMILDQTGTEIIGQCVMSGKEVKERLGGKTEILQVLETEEDRVKALAKYFDMHLREDEIQGIRGMTSALK
ncbi:Arylamine N-acetyltransferase [Penicillium concentricum]|uniref:Arylamine N-acetyltransferase n=1 Tax=Penicillium concentricum TaxID=293559 RepID=A0A9W9VAK6_9EURO|nr:Arylamine N-acetyltransferase [Penicillium concentricum]KAJ5375053.1 Arylamine N-acetyltransferase [Penicillium concentricum]